jgi:hypothetical protein
MESAAMVILNFAQAVGSDGMTTSDDTSWILGWVENKLRTELALAQNGVL